MRVASESTQRGGASAARRMAHWARSIAKYCAVIVRFQALLRRAFHGELSPRDGGITPMGYLVFPESCAAIELDALLVAVFSFGPAIETVSTPMIRLLNTIQEFIVARLFHARSRYLNIY
jgi:hypothetical protein